MKLFKFIKTQQDIIMTLAEAISSLTAADVQNDKAFLEITAKLAELQASIQALTDQLANVTLTAEQQAAVDAVVENAANLDAIVPDAPVVA